MKQPTNRATSQGGQIKRARTSEKAVNAPAAQQQAERCTYPGCKFHHDISKCSLRKTDLTNGFERVPACRGATLEPSSEGTPTTSTPFLADETHVAHVARVDSALGVANSSGKSRDFFPRVVNGGGSKSKRVFSSSRSDARVAASTQAQLKSQPRSKPGKTKKRRRVRRSGSRLAPQEEYVLTNVCLL